MNGDPVIFDHVTLAKLGLSSPFDQKIAVSLLNGCAAIVSDAKLQVLKNLAGTLKRKASEMEQMYFQLNAPRGAHIQPTSNEYTAMKDKFERLSKEMATLKESANSQLTRGNDATLQLADMCRERNELSKVFHAKTDECEKLKEKISTLEQGNADLNAQVRTLSEKLGTQCAGLEESYLIASLSLQKQVSILKDQLSRATNLSAFIDTVTDKQVVCPIPTRDGRILSLSAILKQWKTTQGDNEGEISATFTYAGDQTSIASHEQVSLIRNIANDVGVDMTSPIHLQYTQGANTTECHDILFNEQLHIFSKVCKLIRRKAPNAYDKLVVNVRSHMLCIKSSFVEDSDRPHLISFELLDHGHPQDTVMEVKILINDPTVFPEVTFK